MGGLTKSYGAVILKTAPGDAQSPEAGRCLSTGAPVFSYEVTVRLGAGRLLLFVRLNEQAANAYDDKAELKQL